MKPPAESCLLGRSVFGYISEAFGLEVGMWNLAFERTL